MVRNEPSSGQVFTGTSHDVIVVGAGIGGVYAIHRFRQQGLSVLGLEGGGGVGGVWYHNHYPGARVDVESPDYCYFFSPELYREWKWSERYASQPELLAYINFVADKFGIKPHILFNTWMTGAQWRDGTWLVRTSDGRNFTGRFLVMATGNLSAARKPDFKGLDRFRGDWVQTSHWPDRQVKTAGQRIGVIGTGSSGVQTIPVLAREANHLYVFQRTPNYSVPANNGPIDRELYEATCADVTGTWEKLISNRMGAHMQLGTRPAADYSEEERLRELERKWAISGHGMNAVFSDQGTNQAANDIVAEFVRGKIRQIVKDPVLAQKLCPEYPIGTRRLCVDIGYYATYNRDNVTLIDAREEAIEEITETGLRTTKNHYELDVIVFALGFHAFTGQIDRANIRNEHGKSPTDHWKRGPRTYLGIMTTGFPNYFMLTGPGSPSVLANMFVGNEYHVNWIGELMGYMRTQGYSTVEPTEEAQGEWTEHVAEVSQPLIRLRVDNYMVHVNKDDQSRVFIPYVGGLGRYVARCREVMAKGYEGFRFDQSVIKRPPTAIRRNDVVEVLQDGLSR